MKKTIRFYLNILIVSCLSLLYYNTSYSQENSAVDIDLALSNLPKTKTPQGEVIITPKIKDPLSYNYNGAKLVLNEDFKDNRNRWSQDKEKDSINEQLVFFRPGTGLELQLRNDTSRPANTIGMKSGFDFTKNFEYEVAFNTQQASLKSNIRMSFCIATDTSHSGGINLFIDNKGKLSISTPQKVSTKKWSGKTFYIPRKKRNAKTKICIRHMDGIYDVFYNGHYLGRLKDQPVIKGNELHIGTYQPNTTVTINAIRLYGL